MVLELLFQQQNFSKYFIMNNIILYITILLSCVFSTQNIDFIFHNNEKNDPISKSNYDDYTFEYSIKSKQNAPNEWKSLNIKKRGVFKQPESYNDYIKFTIEYDFNKSFDNMISQIYIDFKITNNNSSDIYTADQILKCDFWGCPADITKSKLQPSPSDKQIFFPNNTNQVIPELNSSESAGLIKLFFKPPKITIKGNIYSNIPNIRIDSVKCNLSESSSNYLTLNENTDKNNSFFSRTIEVNEGKLNNFLKSKRKPYIHFYAKNTYSYFFEINT